MNVIWKLSAMLLVVGPAACARAPASSVANHASTAAPAQAVATELAPAVHTETPHVLDETLPPVMVYKSPTCGCCEMWVEHMRAAGFRVEITNTQDLGAMKTRAGVPAGQGSCHTAKVGNYYLEGHVPASDVKRLLAERRDVRGLIVPGMVLGSPGMEQGGVRRAYDVLLLAKDGSTSVFEHHGI